MMISEIKALYIHIPFCNCICSYCDFYKMIAKEKEKDKYINYLIKELEFKKNLLTNIETIYIGGGTPSSIKPKTLEKLFQELSFYFDLSKIKEFTVECNPKDITNELGSLFKKYNVNRVSLGVQTFNKKKLSILSRNYLNKKKEKSLSFFRRHHTYNDLKKDIKILKSFNITNINFDFIYGLYIDNFKLIKKDINKAIKLNVKHLSLYSLIIEDNTILFRLYNDGKIKILKDDKEAKLYMKIISYLKKKHFKHYEISNFSLSGYESLHNLTYWNNQNYLALGASSSYYYNNTRFTNVRNLEKYYNGIDNNCLLFDESTNLSKHDMMIEEVMLGLRKIEGISVIKFYEKYNEDIFKVFPNIKDLIKLNFLKQDNDNIYIAEDKLYISNEILVKII